MLDVGETDLRSGGSPATRVPAEEPGVHGSDPASPPGPQDQAPAHHAQERPIPTRHRIVMTLAVAVPCLGVVVALASLWWHGGVEWLYVNMLIVGWILTGTGITVGYHRLMSHRSFHTHPWLRNLWIALGALSVQKSPLEWCAVHRKHHAMSDREGDPHSPRLEGAGWWNTAKGLWHAQVGWLFTNHLLTTHKERYVPDLRNDAFVMWVHRHYDTLWIPGSFLIPALIGGVLAASWEGVWLGFLWGGLVRIFVVHHITWSINSICHTFGSRDYDVNDNSRNNFLCALLGHGEGWHNNHHAFPSSARQGFKWWQYDLSWWIIRAMERLGLAWNVRLPSPQAVAARVSS